MDTDEELFTCRKCGGSFPDKGFYHYRRKVFYKGRDPALVGKLMHAIGDRLPDCLECWKAARELGYKKNKEKKAKAATQPPDLSWTSILGVSPIPKKESNT